MANPFSGREIDLKRFFPEEENLEREEQDPLKNWYIPVDQLPDKNTISKDVEVIAMEETWEEFHDHPIDDEPTQVEFNKLIETELMIELAEAEITHQDQLDTFDIEGEDELCDGNCACCNGCDEYRASETERTEHLRAFGFEEEDKWYNGFCESCDGCNDPNFALPVADFLPDEAEIEMWEEMEIEAMPWPSHSSPQIEPMNPWSLLALKKLNSGEYPRWEIRICKSPGRGRVQRCRGRRNPDRIRKECHEKLQVLFAQERWHEEKYEEFLRFQSELFEASEL
jgi:hypothetical protein